MIANQHTRPGRRTGTMLALSLMLVVNAVLPAAAFDAGSSTRDKLVAAQSEVAEIGNEKFDGALEEFAKALEAKRWTADGEPNRKDGDKTFEHGKKATEKLRKESDLLPDPSLVDRVALIFRNAAVLAGAETVPKAVEDLAKGDEELAKAHQHHAIDDYKDAWEEAMKASESSSSGGDGTYGDSHVYTFTMLNVLTGEVLTVSGSSDSNEGYLFSPAFGPGDTYLSAEQRAAAIAGSEAAGYPTGLPSDWDANLGGVIQVHVSCSDAFPEGYGAKSDPQATTEWLVARAQIQKDSKTCDLVMIEIPDDPGPTD